MIIITVCLLLMRFDEDFIKSKNINSISEAETVVPEGRYHLCEESFRLIQVCLDFSEPKAYHSLKMWVWSQATCLFVSEHQKHLEHTKETLKPS